MYSRTQSRAGAHNELNVDLRSAAAPLPGNEFAPPPRALKAREDIGPIR